MANPQCRTCRIDGISIPTQIIQRLLKHSVRAIVVRIESDRLAKQLFGA
jgi:hypothetical protein